VSNACIAFLFGVLNQAVKKLIIIPQNNQSKIILMKSKIYTFVAILATAFAGIIPFKGYSSTISDSVTMGNLYSNEIYYSMSNGQQGQVNRGLWDIAFRTNIYSASILTNDGFGVELYTYPLSDTSGWSKTIDISGIANWKKMVNSTTDWEEGAFCRNQKGHPDYGWGKYNVVTNDVVGDSLFIIKLRDGTYRKLWIIQKFSLDNIYEFRFANIDGTGDTKIVLECATLTAKNFVGYSITTNQVVDFEPVASAKWDILFTRYMYTYPATSPNAGLLNLSTGVLSNYNVKVKKFEHVPTDTILTAMPPMDMTRSPIGWDWKKFANSSYTVNDSLVYFVQDLGGKIYRLVFTKFVGSSTGKIFFNSTLNSFTGVNEVEKSGFNAAIYPNPVNDVMNLVINPGKSKLAVVSILDMSGRMVLNKKYEIQAEDLSTLQIPVSDLPSGMYMVKIQAGGKVISRKVIVNN
jgi:hypothetical protein